METTGPVAGQKYCTQCGKALFQQAEICPGCGCRQMPAPVVVIDRNSGSMILMAVLNILWPGLGNLVIGDKRGWLYGFLNFLVIAASIFTFGAASILMSAFTIYRGYEFLNRKLAGSELAERYV